MRTGGRPGGPGWGRARHLTSAGPYEVLRRLLGPAVEEAGGVDALDLIPGSANGFQVNGIIGQPEVQSGLDRELGFKEEMKKHPGIKVAAVLNGGGVRDKALKAAEDMLQGNPNLKGIFGINDDSALGALSAAEARGRNEIVIVGYDAIPEAVSAVRLIPGQTRMTTPTATERRPFKPSAHLIFVSCVLAIFVARSNVDSIGDLPIGVVDSSTLARTRYTGSWG